MRSRIRLPRPRRYDPRAWHRKFALFPRKIEVGEAETPSKFHPAYRWVWLEYVERQRDGIRWQYRVGTERYDAQRQEIGKLLEHIFKKSFEPKDDPPQDKDPFIKAIRERFNKG